MAKPLSPHDEEDDPIGFPTGYIRLDPFKCRYNESDKVSTCFTLAVHFNSAKERNDFARKVKAAMKVRGRWLLGRLR